MSTGGNEMKDYHVFRKQRVTNRGKIIHKWYYYFVKDGKQVQRVCKGCQTRNEAYAFVGKLPELSGSGSVLVKTIAEQMFFPGSGHMKRRIQLGKPLDPHSMEEGRAIMKKVIGQWGDKPLSSLKVEEVGQYLFALERSGSYKHNFICKVKEMYREAYWYGCDIPAPSFPSFAVKSKKGDIFTPEELTKLFKPELYKDKDLYLFYLCCLSGGLRMGEARGLRPKQILFDRKALIVDGFVKRNGTRTNYNKKGTEEHPKLRIVPFPDITLNLLREHIAEYRIADDDFIFKGYIDPDKPITACYAHTNLKRMMKKAGIAIDKRRLTVHSFRFTYVTHMRRELPVETVMKLVGHTTTGMTEYYNKRVLDESLAGLTGADTAVAKLFVRNHDEEITVNRNKIGKVYIWSDLHLGHEDIIGYGNQPFKDAVEMNDALLQIWKTAVTPADTIINLGDVALNLDKEYLTKAIQRMPGHKILVMGNHDREKPAGWWQEVGFDEVYPHPIVYEGKCILSHDIVGMVTGSEFINIHGHIHNLNAGIPNCINVSVEMTGYKPVLLEELIQKQDK
jgi:calcineurin-like phosphoesterase family protein/integrase